MDDVKVGAVLRAVRLRRGWRQSDVAAAASVSRTFVSLIERGNLDQAALRSVRQVCGAIGIRVFLDVRWRGADLAKLVDERHATLALSISRRLTADGWEVTAERTYSIFGERGSVDIVAWHPRCRAFLIVEIKSEIVDTQDLFAAFDRKRRLAARIAREMGHDPQVYGAIIALPEETAARRWVVRFGSMLEHGYPARGLAIRSWIKEPSRDLRGVWFLSISNRGAGKRQRGGARRVRPPRTASDKRENSLRGEPIQGREPPTSHSSTRVAISQEPPETVS